ncbi:hypothetical protein ACLBYD_26440 [Rhodococcus sp. C26F]
MVTAQREVVDPPDRCGLDRPIRDEARDTQQRVPADVYPESGGEAGTGAAGHGQSDRLDHRVEYRGSSSPALCQSWYLLGECCCITAVVGTEESTDDMLEDDRMRAYRRVCGTAPIP